MGPDLNVLGSVAKIQNISSKLIILKNIDILRGLDLIKFLFLESKAHENTALFHSICQDNISTKFEKNENVKK